MERLIDRPDLDERIVIETGGDVVEQSGPAPRRRRSRCVAGAAVIAVVVLVANVFAGGHGGRIHPASVSVSGPVEGPPWADATERATRIPVDPMFVELPPFAQLTDHGAAPFAEMPPLSDYELDGQST